MNTIEKIIEKSFREMKKTAYKKANKESKLIFPKKRDDSIRFSEQEARLLFIRELEFGNNKHSFYYSIETPTRKCYKGFSIGEPEIASNNDGRSGSIDLTVYNAQFQREHLLEFKYGNVDTCKKDFLKLLCDEERCMTNYYINILKNFDNGTFQSLENKYQKSVNYVFEKYNSSILSKMVIIVGILDEDKDINSDFFIYHEISKNERKVKKREK